jgi:hypothetical protein
VHVGANVEEQSAADGVTSALDRACVAFISGGDV